MAAGLSASLNRFEEVINGADSNWKRTKKRITSLAEDENLLAGYDRKFFLAADSRSSSGPIAGNVVDYNYTVEVEFARHFGGGDRGGSDFFSLQKTLEDEVNTIEQSLLYRQNWDYTNTGIVLVNLNLSELSKSDLSLGQMVWTSTFFVRIRQANAAVSV